MSFFKLPPPGWDFSDEFKEWMLLRAPYELAEIHELYPDVPEFFFAITKDEMDAKRAKHVIEFEKRNKNAPAFVYKNAL